MWYLRKKQISLILGLGYIKLIISLTIYECNDLLVLKKNLFNSNKFLFDPKIFYLNLKNVNCRKKWLIKLSLHSAFHPSTVFYLIWMWPSKIIFTSNGSRKNQRYFLCWFWIWFLWIFRWILRWSKYGKKLKLNSRLKFWPQGHGSTGSRVQIPVKVRVR